MGLLGEDKRLSDTALVAVLLLAMLVALIGLIMVTQYLILSFVLFCLIGIVASVTLMIKGAKLIWQEDKQFFSAPVNDERELLRTMRHNGHSITPVEVAMEILLSVEPPLSRGSRP